MLTLAEKFKKATFVERRRREIYESTASHFRKDVDFFNLWVDNALTVVKITSFWDTKTKKPLSPPLFEEIED